MTFYLRMASGVIWRHKKWPILWPPYPFYLQRWIDLFSKKQKNLETHDKFKTPLTSFYVDVINGWSLALIMDRYFWPFYFRCILCGFQLMFSFKKAPRNFIDLVLSISWFFIFSFGKTCGILFFARFVEKQVFVSYFVLGFFCFFHIKVACQVDIKLFFYGLILLYFDNTN